MEMVLEWPKVIKLSDAECEICELLGKLRNKSARAAGVKDAYVSDDEKPVEADQQGQAAEFAVAKSLNCYPDMSPGPRSGGWDMYVGRRKVLVSIDAKYSKYETATLLITKKKTVNDSDIFVLVTGKMPRFVIQGWIPSNKAMIDYFWERYKQPNGKSFGEGWTLAQSDLIPWGSCKMPPGLVLALAEDAKKPKPAPERPEPIAGEGVDHFPPMDYDEPPPEEDNPFAEENPFQ